MKNKIIWVIGVGIIIIVAVVLFGLFHKTKDVSSNIDSSIMEIKIGEVKSFSEVPNLSLKFLDVTEDGRCPIGYQCAQVGWATVQIHISLGETAVTKEMSTIGGKYPSEVTVGNNTIRFISLKPDRTSPDAMKKDRYQAVFTVESSTTTDTESTD